MRSAYYVILALCGLLIASPAFAEPQSGHTQWGPWSFDWEVRDLAGIALINVSYNNERVLAKASLPVIRVKYLRDRPWWDPRSWFSTGGTEGCGPFQDRIKWSNMVSVPNCGNQKVCHESYSVGGTDWLELGVYARIGEYHLYQAWYLSKEGQIQALVQSKGLSCKIDHSHHPYWRLDFDIDGNDSDQMFVHDDGGPDEGWGPGWHKYTNERDIVKKSSANRVWYARDQPSGHGVWVLPGTDDGTADAFSDKDVAVRRQNTVEDEPWPFGARGHLGYKDNDDIQERDIVFWYVAHLPHKAEAGPDPWYWVGPVLRVHR
jgi:hypothetical protein